jgi:hypothetical protein
MDLRDNINKIHSDLLLLKNIGDTVTIKENSSKEFGNHFEITAEHDGMKAKVIIEKTEVENPSFRWRYYANPNDESNGIVERNSTINGFVHDLLDIFDKKRFDSDYLSQITD